MCLDSTRTELKHEWNRDVTCKMAKPYCGHERYGESVTKMCPETCKREGCGFAPAPTPGACSDDPNWRDDAGNSCSSAAITAEWCDDNGHERFPGFGNCAANDRGCKPANEACCTCANAATCVDATPRELFHEWGKRVTCEQVKTHCGHAIYGEAVTKMCPKTCQRSGCAGGGELKDEDGEKEKQDTYAFQKERGGCKDATPEEIKEEWEKTLTCEDVTDYCSHPRLGEEINRMCPVSCGTCVVEPPSSSKGGSDGGSDDGGGGSSAGIIVAIVAAIAVVGAGFGAFAYWKSRNRDMLNQSYVTLAADGGVGEA